MESQLSEPGPEDLVERLGRLEAAVHRAADALGRLREENERLRKELSRTTADRKQMASQIDAILHDIDKLELD